MSEKDASGAALPVPNGSYEFNFTHKLFAVTGCVFRKAANGRDVALFVPLGSVTAALPIDSLAASFGIPEDSEDIQLLKRVADALKFVKEIRPGDSIPSEVIDGRASWMVDEKYQLAARARISMQLVAWMSGRDLESIDIRELVARAEQPKTRRMVQEAFGAIAEKLGYGADRRQEVVDLVDRFAGELAYIEALRDRFHGLRRIMASLKSLYSAYRRERAIEEMITRCTSLLNKPVQSVFDAFDGLDANTGELLQTLKRYDTQVAYVRATRNELRETLLLWEELLEKWEGVKPVPGGPAELAVRETYRFAARNFSVAMAWGGVG